MNPLVETPQPSPVDIVAANDDHVNVDPTFDHQSDSIVVTTVSSSSHGWDAYDVWHRMIKEPRDRRRHD